MCEFLSLPHDPKHIDSCPRNLLPIMTDLGVAEKGALVQDSPVSHASSTAEASFDLAAERRLLRKLDVRIMPVLWILYLVNFIDRYVFPVTSMMRPILACCRKRQIQQQGLIVANNGCVCS